jgi:DNA mismatch endonuclease (patch repair protein)
MTDKLSPARRSENMRRIRAKGTKPELAVRSILRELGVVYRLHAKELPGKPDIVRRRDKRAVFVHGCFWHLHPRKDCLDSRLPKSNAGYWHAKLARNAERDREHVSALRSLGWRVLTIWDCQLRQPARVRARLKTFFTLSNARHVYPR